LLTDDAACLALCDRASEEDPGTWLEGECLPPEHADRVAAAERLVLTHPSWSDRLVGSVTGLSDKTVGALRRRANAAGQQSDSDNRVGRDGRSRPVDGTEGRLRASRIIAGNPEASLRRIAREAGIAVSTAQDVRRRMEQGRSPLPERQSASGSVTVSLVSPPQLAADDEPRTPSRRSGRNPARKRRRSSPPRADAVAAAMAQLRKDPSLRLTESGRALLRLLAGQQAALAAYYRLVETVPAHCSDALATVVGAYAWAWGEAERRLEV
jgi:hypothetical protein